MGRMKATKKNKTTLKKGEKKTMKKTKRAAAKKAAPRKTTQMTKKTQRPLKVTEPLKKSELYTHLAECAELSRREIGTIFEVLAEVIHCHLKKGGPGEFTVPGLMKCKVTRKPATKARKGINPFTGEPTVFKAKPARNVIKVRPLKKMKEMAN